MHTITHDREIDRWVGNSAVLTEDPGSVPHPHEGKQVSVIPISGILSLSSDFHGIQKTHDTHKPI